MNHTSTSDVKLKTVTSFDEFLRLRREWNGLLEESEKDLVFLRHEWFAAWWQAFGGGRKLLIVLAEGEGGVLGIAPLMRCQSAFRGIPVRGIEFLANDDSPACGFILKKNREDLAGIFMEFLLRDCRDWDVVQLKNMIHGGAVKGAIVGALESAGRKYILSPGLNSPYIEIDCSWEEYFKGLSSKSRKTIRNVCNRMRRLGDVEVVESVDMGGFDDMVSVSEKGWKYREGKAFVNRPERFRFFRLLSEAARDEGWLSIWHVYKDREPIAYEYHLRYKGSDTALLSEYNSDYGKFSPGTFLDHEIIKSLFVRGVRVYDMCGVHDEYKRKWTDKVRDYKNLTVFNDSLYSGLLYFLEEKPVRLIKRIRDRVVVPGARAAIVIVVPVEGGTRRSCRGDVVR